MKYIFVKMVNNLKSILEENGYPITEGPNYIQTAGLWREGNNKTAICIYYKDDLVCDFVTGEKFDIKTLIGKILNIQDKDKLEEFLNNKQIYSAPKKEIEEVIIKSKKIQSKDFLLKLRPDHKYWINRGISEKLLVNLKGGTYKDKYYFPVFNKEGLVLGWSARVIKGDNNKKYIIRGEKKGFVYPAFFNYKDIINKKEVILVEGISDAISIITSEIKHVLVLFGLECSFSIINFLLRAQVENIKIALNSDEPGKIAAEKLKRKLNKYFDGNKIKIIFPENNYKDWNEVLVREGQYSIIKQLK